MCCFDIESTNRKSKKYMLYPVSAQAKPTMPRLGDAVQRWLRHPEPSSWSYKSTIRKNDSLCFFSFRVLFACPKRTKRTKRGMLSSFKHLLSPRGDRCEQSAPTVRQLLNHGYRFETLKRRLGFAAVPCQAMANLAGRSNGAGLGANIAR